MIAAILIGVYLLIGLCLACYMVRSEVRDGANDSAELGLMFVCVIPLWGIGVPFFIGFFTLAALGDALRWVFKRRG